MLQTRSSSTEVKLLSPRRLHWLPVSTAVIPKAWMVAVNEQGEIAFRIIETIRIEKDSPSASIQSFPTFEADQFRSGNLALLKHSMRDALIDEGLFQKEAAAMLATWNKSYFENAGTRIFYIVPSEWLDYHLPVDVSIPHQLSRAFIGRIDLID
jgi:acyl-homoserine lactone acylase PvdQ